MRIFIFILLAAFTITASAQKSSVEKFIKKQAKTEGFSVQEIDLKSEDFATQFKVEGEDIQNALEQLDIIKILSSDSSSTDASRSTFFSKAQKALANEAYIELAKVQSNDGEAVSAYANQMDNGLIREFVMLVGEDDTALMIYVKGEMDLASLFSSEMFASMIAGKKGKDCD